MEQLHPAPCGGRPSAPAAPLTAVRLGGWWSWVRFETVYRSYQRNPRLHCRRATVYFCSEKQILS